eukprot:729229-Rhodomonas_salina.1
MRSAPSAPHACLGIFEHLARLTRRVSLRRPGPRPRPRPASERGNLKVGWSGRGCGAQPEPEARSEEDLRSTLTPSLRDSVTRRRHVGLRGSHCGSVARARALAAVAAAGGGARLARRGARPGPALPVQSWDESTGIASPPTVSNCSEAARATMQGVPRGDMQGVESCCVHSQAVDLIVASRAVECCVAFCGILRCRGAVIVL